KYNTHYLYPGCGADYILRDEAEEKLLPEELKNDIDKEKNPLTGRDLEKLVKEHMDKLVPLGFSIDTRKHLAQLGNGSVSNELKEEFEKKKITLSKNSVWIKGRYLFRWDRVPGQDEMKFLQFLNNDRDFDWVKDATITKS
ncbi:MAG: hypothetical protein IMF19_05880, partial [Proteobacteria bacterium]|nr:hypothetical protein [Pseudomonadota bacterium]